jgi:hypothetical protein
LLRTIVDDYWPERPWIAKLREHCGAEFEMKGEFVATMVCAPAAAQQSQVESNEDSDSGATPQR